MIVLKQKSLEEILKMLENSKNVLIVGCDGCAAIYQVGGMRQAELISALLEMARKIKGSAEIKTRVTTVLRQCDQQIVTTSISPLIRDYEAILSMACGVGVQTLADIFEDKIVIPANDTMFIGMQDFEAKKFYELCSACGDCVLSETGGICPVTRCAKGLLNGPCGGQVNGKCEVGRYTKDCAWVLIWKRLKQRGRLDLFTKFRPFRVNRQHPPRELKLPIT